MTKTTRGCHLLKVGIALLFLFIVSGMDAQIDTYRPWVRWWWNGDKVDSAEIVRELQLLKDAGIGGVEINPIAFPERTNDLGIKSLKWLSPEWCHQLQIALDKAKELHLGCDLLVGSGWPYGCENLAMEERAQVMIVNAVKVRGPQIYKTKTDSLIHPVIPKVTDPDKHFTAEIVSLQLVPAKMESLSQVVDLKEFIKGKTVKTEIPEGDYFIYALIRFTSFADVINGAPGASGPILDHFNATTVRKYLDRMSTTLADNLRMPLSYYLRAFFTDSMELEGSNWCSDFASEFQKRNGYDIMPYLPYILFKVGRLGSVVDFNYGAEKSLELQEELSRVRYDYETTKAQLLQERFWDTFTQWCKDQGVQSRAQGYGRGFDPMAASMVLDIPEGESWTMNWLRHHLGEEMPDSDYRRGRGYTMIDKYVSSAAHLSGKQLISCEEMTNTYRVFNTTLELLKIGSDQSAQSGITHSIWHGFNYSPPEAEFPGWIQYGSYLNENNTWWPFFKRLNDYRARLCQQLQNSTQFADMAILPANGDLWSQWGVQTDPFPERLNVTYTSLLWEAISKNGGSADYISEGVIQKSTIEDGMLKYGNRSYSVIWLPGLHSIQTETANKLNQFVQSGGRVFCFNSKPETTLGMKEEPIDNHLFTLINWNNGSFMEWYGDMAKEHHLPSYITISHPDVFFMQTRWQRTDGAEVFFLTNSNRFNSIEQQLFFDQSVIKDKDAFVYVLDDADNFSSVKNATPRKYLLTVENDGSYRLHFGPAESVLLVFEKKNEQATEAFSPILPNENAVDCSRNWDLELLSKFTERKSYFIDTLMDIKEIPEEKHFCGTAIYRKRINISDTTNVILNLGNVVGVSELFVNGDSVGTKWYGERIWDISPFVKKGENNLEIRVTTTMGNYLKSLTDNKVAMYWVNRKGREQAYEPQGILGPITLTGLTTRKQFLATDFGLVGDSITLNTRMLQRAIDSISAMGGGEIVFPSGNYVTGTVYLKSNVHLYLQKNATLLGSTNPFDYQKDPYIRWMAMIFAVGQKNIGIEGEGRIDGRGFTVACNFIECIHRGLISDPLKYDRPNETNRPVNIYFRECDTVDIYGITLKDPGCWNQVYDRCTHLLVDGITVDSKSYWNNDGIDIVDCRDVKVSNCFFDAADDAICFKSHNKNCMCEEIEVSDCVARSSANAIKFGTVSAGGFRNARIHDIRIYDTYRSAVTFAAVDGGVVENIGVSNIRATHTGNAIYLRTAKRNKDDRIGTMRNITFKDIYVEVAATKADAGYRYEGPIEDLPRNISPASIVGSTHSDIRDITLQNVEIHYPGGGDPKYAYRGTSDQELSSIPEMLTAYPEFSQFKELPAWGFYIRHAQNIIFDKVSLYIEKCDYRPALVAFDVYGVWMAGVLTQMPAKNWRKCKKTVHTFFIKDNFCFYD